MTPLDVVIALLLLGVAFYGVTRGGVRQLTGAIGWIAGIVVAAMFAPLLQLRLEESVGMQPPWSAVVAFVALVLIVVVFAKLIGALLQRILWRSRILRVADSVIGLGVALIALALVISTAAVAIDWSPQDSRLQGPLRQSRIVSFLMKSLQGSLQIRQRTSD